MTTEIRTKQLFSALSLSAKRYQQCKTKREQHQKKSREIAEQLPDEQREQLCATVDHLQNIETLLVGYELGRIGTSAFPLLFPLSITEGQFESLWRQLPSTYDTFLAQRVHDQQSDEKR
jgi:hypothetical protein